MIDFASTPKGTYTVLDSSTNPTETKGTAKVGEKTYTVDYETQIKVPAGEAAINGSTFNGATALTLDTTKDGATLNSGTVNDGGKTYTVRDNDVTAVDSEGKYTVYTTLDNKTPELTATTGVITIEGLASLEGITIKDKVVTLRAENLNGKNVTLTGEGYTLALSDVSAPSDIEAAFDGLTYKSSGNTAGYTLDEGAQSITYTKAVEPTDLFTVEGIVDTVGITVNSDGNSADVEFNLWIGIADGFVFNDAITVTGVDSYDNIKVVNGGLNFNDANAASDQNIHIAGTSSVSVNGSARNLIDGDFDTTNGLELAHTQQTLASILFDGTNVMFYDANNHTIDPAGNNEMLNFVTIEAADTALLHVFGNVSSVNGAALTDINYAVGDNGVTISGFDIDELANLHFAFSEIPIVILMLTATPMPMRTTTIQLRRHRPTTLLLRLLRTTPLRQT